MKYDAQDCELIYKNKLTPSIYDFRLKNAALAKISKPGQFAQVAVRGKTLRRPISICDIIVDTIRIVFEVRGEGTEILSESNTGDMINIISPLGRGFEINPKKKTAFIGGGIGVPPMLYSARQCGENAIVIIGFRNKEAVILEEDFKKLGCRVILTTDDGSYGLHGFVTQPLEEIINSAEAVCACGPTPMLKGISEIAEKNNVDCQISLEQRMACGIGACLGCAVLVRNGEAEIYKHVCKDGPVFNSKEVVF